MYPLHAAQLRLAVLRLAANRAVDRAMRRLHDMPTWTERLVETTGVPAEIVGTVMAARFHERMKVDESNCRWCGEAAAEARAELENEDD